MTTTELIRPDLQALINMAISRLTLVREAVIDGDKPITPKVAKHAREGKALVLLVIQEINNVREAQKAAPAKKAK